MNPQTILLLLLLMGTAIAQDSTSQAPPERGPFCRVNGTDVAGCVTPPRMNYSPEPDYPNKERKAKHQGTVFLALVVGADGLPRDIVVSRSLSHDFDKAAIDSVKRWRFSPATKEGKPVAAEIKVEVAFRLY